MCGIGILLESAKIQVSNGVIQEILQNQVEEEKTLGRRTEGLKSHPKTEQEQQENNAEPFVPFSATSKEIIELLTLRTSQRGPNHTGDSNINLPQESGNCTFISSVLNLRGPPTVQPLLDESNNILLWNGEVFDHNTVLQNENDTNILLNLLKNSKNIPETLAEIQGPFSFIYWQESTKTLWFGRDILGRRSLLIHSSYQENDPEKNKNFKLILSSVAFEDPFGKSWFEIPTSGIFSISFENSNENEVKQINTHLWPENKYPFKKRKITQIPDTIDDLKDALISEFLKMLSDAVEIRVTNIPEPQNNSARLGILFSGGIDSAILVFFLNGNPDSAALSDIHLPKNEIIDLINVSFSENEENFDKVPDRLSAISTLEELKKISDRPWNFVKVNVLHSEIAEFTEQIFSLCYPCNTMMDITIATALFFAARGKGIDSESNTKVLLTGAGADEQLAGYARHQTSFKIDSWSGLQRELEKDFNRIWKRNLGRDDRVLSDSGKEVRFPFLDENFVEFLSNLSLWQVCDLTKEKGIGDKKILREAAKKLGLSNSAFLAKRAIQFGTRISGYYSENQKKTRKEKKKCGQDTFIL